MDSVVAPLGNAFEIKTLQSGSPSVAADKAGPLQVSVARDGISGSVNLTSVIRSVGEESVANRVVDPLRLQRNKNCQGDNA